MSNSNWPESVAVVSVAASVGWILTPWDRVGPIRWDAVSAIGTVAAVVVALAIPIWQNWDRRREKARSEAIEEWAVLQEAHRLFSEVRNNVEIWASGGKVPSLLYIQALVDDLAATKASVKTPIGVHTMNAIIGVARTFRGAVESSEKTPSGLMQGLDGRFIQSELTDRLAACNKLQVAWNGEVIRQAVRIGAIEVLPR